MLPSTRRLIVLGSRSPRRLELLQLFVPPEQIRVVPPRIEKEAGFEDADDLPAVLCRLQQIARSKCEDVRSQVLSGVPGIAPAEVASVVTADTTIIVADSAGQPRVLGQPPEDETYAETVRQWFREFYAGRAHIAATALCVADLAGRWCERLVQSQVEFRSDVETYLEWYIATGEPRGKAGGYALQGAGSVFVTRVEGSLSNVVGLPLEVLWDVLCQRSVAPD